jgi:hypothetical protein
MKQVADLLRRVWQPNPPSSDTQTAVMTGERDRSSMADFVRILQTYDKGRTDQAAEIEAEGSPQAT